MGSWLALWLQNLGAEIAGFSLKPPTQPNLFELARVAEGMTSIEGDVRDYAALSQALSAHKPEIVVHLAAQPLVRRSYIDPIETYGSNVMGTVHLLEAVRHAPPVRAVLIVTSDKCYENKEWVWGYREDEPMGGYDPYSSSKGCAELVASSMRRSFFNPGDYSRHGVAVATARAGNAIGGGDWSQDRLIPDIIKSFLAREEAQIRSPRAIRPWQHVLEPISGYLALLKKLCSEGPAHAEGWNFGPADSDARPVSYIAERLAGLWGENASWRSDDGLHPHEAHYLKLDCSKARLRLGWTPRWNLDATLENIAAWYKTYVSSPDRLKDFTLRQIADYAHSPSQEPKPADNSNRRLRERAGPVSKKPEEKRIPIARTESCRKKTTKKKNR